MAYVLHDGLLVDSLHLHDDSLEDIEPSVTAWLRELAEEPTIIRQPSASNDTHK